MIIKSVKLENIRSYTSQEIEFPAGSTLLAGDIGSGKSTILLAIEFALFGTKRNDLPASSLLRHGKKAGSVELKFDLDGKEIIVKRVLKRGKEDISQEAGYIVVDDAKKEGTAIELKTDILNLLGYPKQLITKSKDLVYRYTVYTPQEEMKQILLEDKEVRLDTLRRVFNIDKYKRVRENSSVFVHHLKEKKKESEGRIADLEQKKKEKAKQEKDIESHEKKIAELKPKLDELKDKVKDSEKEEEAISKKTEELNQLKKELGFSELNLKNNLEKREENKKRIDDLEKQAVVLKRELGEKENIPMDELKKQIEGKEDEIDLMDKTIKEIIKKISSFKTKHMASEGLKKKILELNECPECKQTVNEEHKQRISEMEGKNIAELEEHIKLHSQQGKEAEAKLGSLKKEMEELRKKESRVSVFAVKLKNLEEKINSREAMEEEQERIKKEIGKINKSKLELNEKIKLFKGVEEEGKKLKQKKEKLLAEERKLELELNSLQRDKENTLKLIWLLNKEIEEKWKVKGSLNHLMQVHNWLEEYFLNLTITMEKHVMLQIHREFDELFQKWFNMLMEDETMAVRLDDEFTPVIEQNGYETLVENLSGGERTAVALSYRLALNKVINDIIGEIKTKDIIMLDEPTDGFSTEQLDKVRDVIDQLGIKQVILVSHEGKIESFVDNIIRVSKQEHISNAV